MEQNYQQREYDRCCESAAADESAARRSRKAAAYAAQAARAEAEEVAGAPGGLDAPPGDFSRRQQ